MTKTNEGAARAASLAEFVTDTLVGDLRDALLGRLKAMPKPWTTMSEGEQQSLIDGCTNAARTLVALAAQIIAANGQPHIVATLEQVLIKDGAKLVLKASRHTPEIHDFIDAAGATVVLALADTQSFGGERSPAKPDPDEPELPVEDAGSSKVKPFKSKD